MFTSVLYYSESAVVPKVQGGFGLGQFGNCVKKYIFLLFLWMASLSSSVNLCPSFFLPAYCQDRGISMSVVLAKRLVDWTQLARYIPHGLWPF